MKSRLRGALGVEIVALGTVGSTNDIARECARSDAPHGFVVIANSQEAGRGRTGRHWHSPAGMNLYMSVLLRPRIEARHMGLLSLIGARAVTRALIPYMGARIKWPNDIVVDSRRLGGIRKLGGILSEARLTGAAVQYAVLGIGLNVNMSEADIPPELRGIATSIRMESGVMIEREDVAARVLDALSDEIARYESRGAGGLLDGIRALCVTLGKDVSIGGVQGRAMDIDEAGRLLIERDGVISPVSAGDVEITD